MRLVVTVGLQIVHVIVAPIKIRWADGLKTRRHRICVARSGLYKDEIN